jgi:hypothetical protein
MLACIDSGELLAALIVLDLNLFFEFLDPSHMLVAPDDVLKVL